MLPLLSSAINKSTSNSFVVLLVCGSVPATARISRTALRAFNIEGVMELVLLLLLSCRKSGDDARERSHSVNVGMGERVENVESEG